MEHKLRDRDVILEVVRGERPWRDLSTLDITITQKGHSWVVQNSRGVRAVAQAADIAQGLLKHRGVPKDLRAWACVLLMGSSFVDLDLEGHPAGDLLLSALWDACFRRPMSDEVFKVAEQLAGGK